MTASWRQPDPSGYPTLDHAVRIIDADLAAEGTQIRIRQEGEAWIGKMWQEGEMPPGHPNWPIYRSTVINAVGHSQEEVVIILAAIIKANRLVVVVS